MFADAGAGCFGGEAERARELAIVDLGVFGAQHGAGELAGEMRLAPPRLRCRKPLQREAEFLLEYKLMVQPRLIVRGQSDDQRALGAAFPVHTPSPGQLRGQTRPTPR